TAGGRHALDDLAGLADLSDRLREASAPLARSGAWIPFSRLSLEEAAAAVATPLQSHRHEHAPPHRPLPGPDGVGRAAARHRRRAARRGPELLPLLPRRRSAREARAARRGAVAVRRRGRAGHRRPRRRLGRRRGARAGPGPARQAEPPFTAALAALRKRLRHGRYRESWVRIVNTGLLERFVEANYPVAVAEVARAARRSLPVR